MDVLLKASATLPALAGIRLCDAQIDKDTGGARFAGSGVFRDQGAEKIVREWFFDDAVMDAVIDAPGAWSFTARMKIAQFEYAGNANGEQTFLIALEATK